MLLQQMLLCSDDLCDTFIDQPKAVRCIMTVCYFPLKVTSYWLMTLHLMHKTQFMGHKVGHRCSHGSRDSHCGI